MNGWQWYEVVAVVVFGLVLIAVTSPRDRWYYIVYWNQGEGED